MTGYNCKIAYASRDLTARERVRLKDTTNCVQLDDAVEKGKPLVIEYDYHADLVIHNDHSRDQKDYSKRVIVAKDGTSYVTGSQSFISAMDEIVDEMLDAGEEFDIEVYKQDSKNYQGKCFLSCTIA